MSGLLAAAFVVLVSLYPGLAIVRPRTLNWDLALEALKELRPVLLQRDKKLAGFNRNFRFTQQKHICAAAKKETPHGRRNQKPKTQRKIYET